MNKLVLKTLSVFLRYNQGKQPASLLRYPNKQINLHQNFYFLKKFEDLKFLAAVKLSSLVQQKRNSSSNDNEPKKKKPNLLMDFDPVIRPEILLTLKNWILTKFIIQPYLDKDFTTKDFTHGAKQAISVVSTLLSQGDFHSLKGLLTDDAINEIKRNFSSLTVKERQDLIIKVTDILFAFPHQIGIIFDDNNNEKRFAEITVVYHCMNDFEELKAQGKMLTENSKEDVKICNYRFIREYTKGVKSDWIINRLGHFKLCHFEN